MFHGAREVRMDCRPLFPFVCDAVHLLGSLFSSSGMPNNSSYSLAAAKPTYQSSPTARRHQRRVAVLLLLLLLRIMPLPRDTALQRPPVHRNLH